MCGRSLKRPCSLSVSYRSISAIYRSIKCVREVSFSDAVIDPFVTPEETLPILSGSVDGMKMKGEELKVLSVIIH